VRHATQDDLDRIEELLAELRAVPELRERKRGNFSMRSQAFLHFHEDSGDLYADVKLDGEFQRMRVTTHTEQLALVRRVRNALG
jgi:N-acetylglutamate synthase-like GNAT family acetyltransferase